MKAFRAFLVVLFVAVAIYTAIVVARYGINLFPFFLGDLAALGWPGQFDLDFLGLLGLSGLWVAWRHEFSAQGWVLGVLAFFGGVLFLSLYLLVTSLRCGGDTAALLLGETRASRRGALSRPDGDPEPTRSSAQ